MLTQELNRKLNKFKVQKKEKATSVNIKKLLLNDKAGTFIILAGVIALGLIFLSSLGTSDKENLSELGFDTTEYHTALSDEILTMVTSIEGAGQARILLTLENSYEYIYLDDGKTLQRINEPEIRGVVVVCEGADSPSVSLQITQMLTTALDIPSTRVFISKLK